MSRPVAVLVASVSGQVNGSRTRVVARLSSARRHGKRGTGTVLLLTPSAGGGSGAEEDARGFLRCWHLAGGRAVVLTVRDGSELPATAPAYVIGVPVPDRAHGLVKWAALAIAASPLVVFARLLGLPTVSFGVNSLARPSIVAAPAIYAHLAEVAKRRGKSTLTVLYRLLAFMQARWARRIPLVVPSIVGRQLAADAGRIYNTVTVPPVIGPCAAHPQILRRAAVIHPSSTMRIGFVGNDVINKGLADVISMAKLVHGAGQRCQVVIRSDDRAGIGRLEQDWTDVDVRMWPKGECLCPLYDSVHFLALPSAGETLGRPALEASQRGVVPIVSVHAGAHEYTDAWGGLAFDLDNHAKTALLVREAWSDWNVLSPIVQRRSLGLAAADNHPWVRWVQQLA